MTRQSTDDDIFDLDLYIIRHRASFLGDVHEVMGEDGTPLITVRAPIRWLRYWLGAVAVVITLLVAWTAAASAIGAAVERLGIVPGHPKDDVSAAIGLTGLVASFLPAYALALVVFPRYRAFFYRQDDGRPILEVAEEPRFLPMRRRFIVTTPDDGPVACCSKGNYPLLFGSRWSCDRPDDEPIFEVDEANPVSGFLDRLLRQMGGGTRTGFFFRRANDADRTPLGTLRTAARGDDRVALDLSDDPSRVVERRLGLALAILIESGGWR